MSSSKMTGNPEIIAQTDRQKYYADNGKSIWRLDPNFRTCFLRNAFAAPVAPRISVGDLSVVKIEVIRGCIIGFEDGKVLSVKMVIPSLAWPDRKQERNVSVVGVQEVVPARLWR